MTGCSYALSLTSLILWPSTLLFKLGQGISGRHAQPSSTSFSACWRLQGLSVPMRLLGCLLLRFYCVSIAGGKEFTVLGALFPNSKQPELRKWEY